MDCNAHVHRSGGEGGGGAPLLKMDASGAQGESPSFYVDTGHIRAIPAVDGLRARMNGPDRTTLLPPTPVGLEQRGFVKDHEWSQGCPLHFKVQAGDGGVVDVRDGHHCLDPLCG